MEAYANSYFRAHDHHKEKSLSSVGLLRQQESNLKKVYNRTGLKRRKKKVS